MNWKITPYWLKGGIIGILVWGISTLVLIPFGRFNGIYEFPYWAIPSLIATMPIYWISEKLHSSISQSLISYFMLTIVFCFIYGAIIGLIAEKIKSRKLLKEKIKQPKNKRPLFLTLSFSTLVMQTIVFGMIFTNDIYQRIFIFSPFVALAGIILTIISYIKEKEHKILQTILLILHILPLLFIAFLIYQLATKGF